MTSSLCGASVNVWTQLSIWELYLLDVAAGILVRLSTYPIELQSREGRNPLKYVEVSGVFQIQFSCYSKTMRIAPFFIGRKIRGGSLSTNMQTQLFLFLFIDFKLNYGTILMIFVLNKIIAVQRNWSLGLEIMTKNQNSRKEVKFCI